MGKRRVLYRSENNNDNTSLEIQPETFSTDDNNNNNIFIGHT